MNNYNERRDNDQEIDLRRVHQNLYKMNKKTTKKKKRSLMKQFKEEAVVLETILEEKKVKEEIE